MSRPASTMTIGGDLTVNRVGFGAMKLTGNQVWGDYPQREVGISLLRSAVELGVRFIDTADVYGPHSNEILIHDALHPYPPGLVIATKGGFVRGGIDYSTLDAVGNPNYLRQSAHMSARRLGVEQIDLYYLHSGRATDVPFETQIETLAGLREDGLIRHIGLSNVTLDQVKTAQTIVDIAAITAHFNAALRTEQDLLTVSEGTGAAFSPWHPLSTYEGANRDQVKEVLAPIARDHDATESQIALSWLLHLSPVCLPIPGTTSLAHLEENFAAQELRLDPEEMAAITAVAS